MRAAIWAAVSSDSQAADGKVSISVQIEKSREIIHSRGWKETVLYQIDESRTKWASLYHAEKFIPELRELNEMASRGEIDIVIMYDFNRFRSLLRQEFDVLCDYGVQMYAITSANEVFDNYDENAKSATGVLIDIHMLLSNNQTSSLQMHYKTKMPTRITEKGLHAGTGRIPYGYRKPEGQQYNKQAVLEPDPITSAHLIRMKDLFLQGVSARQIAQQFNDEQIPAPAGNVWHPRVITYILRNPYYAGLVTWGSSRRQRNRRAGTSKVTKSTPLINKGRHIPLWSEGTHLLLTTEIARRWRSHGGKQTKQLSTLMYCWCGAPIWIIFHRFYMEKNETVWGCSTRKAGHFREVHRTLFPRFVDALIKKLKDEDIELMDIVDKHPELEKIKGDIIRKRQRWMDAFENEEIEGSEYTERVKQLTAEFENIQRQINAIAEENLKAREIQGLIKGFADSIETWPEWAITAEPLEVNTKLHSFIKRVDICENREIEITLAS